MTTYWHYTVNGVRQSALSEEELIQLIRRNGISRYDLIWKDGMKKWKPAGTNFDNHFALYQEKKPRLLMPAIIWIISIALALTLSLQFKAPVPGLVKLAIYLSFLATVVATPVLFRRIFLFAKRVSVKRSRELGLALKIATVVFVCLLAFVYSVQFKLIERRFQTNMVLNSMKEYSITAEPKGNAQKLVIKGTIGPDFAKTLKLRLEQNPNVKILELNSGGGLLGETLDAAKIIEDYPQMATYATGQCASGCIVLLFAANERWADHDLKLGFHGAGSLVGPNDTAEAKKHNIHLRLADAYLDKRHVPSDVTPHKYSSTDTEFYYVEAPRLLASGSLTALMKNGKLLRKEAPVVPTRAAPRRPVTAQNAPSKAYIEQANMLGFEAHSVGILLATVKVKRPDVFDPVEEELKGMMADPTKRTQAVRYIINKTRPQSTNLAGAQELINYLHAVTKQVRYLANQHEWEACVAYLDSRGSVPRKYLDTALEPDIYLTYAAMINSQNAANDDTKKASVATIRIRDRIAMSAKEILMKHLQDGPGDINANSAKAGCMKQLHILDMLSDVEPNQRATIARYFFSNILL